MATVPQDNQDRLWREQALSELAQRHHWEEQEKFWQQIVKHQERQAKYWRDTIVIAVAAILLTAVASIVTAIIAR